MVFWAESLQVPSCLNVVLIGMSPWNTHDNIDIVYLDFSKAFDSVVHSKLVAKLACYGIDRVLLSWLGSFLSNRFQYVKADKSYSSILPVISGVPQGSVLGPLLFILYVNDICTLSQAGVTIKLFADDTQLYTVLVIKFLPDVYRIAWQQYSIGLNIGS